MSGCQGGQLCSELRVFSTLRSSITSLQKPALVEALRGNSTSGRTLQQKTTLYRCERASVAILGYRKDMSLTITCAQHVSSQRLVSVVEHVCAHVNVCAYTHVCVVESMCKYLCVYICDACKRARTHTHTHTHMQACTHTKICADLNVFSTFVQTHKACDYAKFRLACADVARLRA